MLVGDAHDEGFGAFKRDRWNLGIHKSFYALEGHNRNLVGHVKRGLGLSEHLFDAHSGCSLEERGAAIGETYYSQVGDDQVHRSR